LRLNKTEGLPVIKKSRFLLAIQTGIILMGLCGLFACNSNNTSTGQSCTLIGCSSGLNLNLTGKVPNTFELELIPSIGEKRLVQCPAGGSGTICLGEKAILIQNFTPEEVAITVSYDGKKVTQNFVPSYSDSRPNGPNCEPACKQAQLTINIPD
jgi:hypothetical protein